MDYVLLAFFAAVLGGLAVFVALDARRRRLQETHRTQTLTAEQLRRDREALKDYERKLTATHQSLDQAQVVLREQQEHFAEQKVSYEELSAENMVLKGDLRNLHIQQQKLVLDRALQAEGQNAIAVRCNDLAAHYLDDQVKWVSRSLNPTNYATSKERLASAIAHCREIGVVVENEAEVKIFNDLKREYELAVRAAAEREHQAAIKARMREEVRREAELRKQQEDLEKERAAIQRALDNALGEAADQHQQEIAELRAKLADAETRIQRTVSQAELTKSGHVYVISNVGSFGEGVFKVGLTRRLEPRERIDELGDASVPFPFDVHMMISSEDAPKLESDLHRALHRMRVNRANPRKEFFRSDIETIHRLVRQNHGDVEYVADAEALEYRQSQSMSEEDEEVIEHAYSEQGENLGE